MKPMHGATKEEVSEFLREHAKPGWVFQINEHYPSKGFVGAFILATEIKPWGIQGFVPHIETFDKQASIYIRPKWEHLDYIGVASLVPDDLHDPE